MVELEWDLLRPWAGLRPGRESVSHLLKFVRTAPFSDAESALAETRRALEGFAELPVQFVERGDDDALQGTAWEMAVLWSISQGRSFAEPLLDGSPHVVVVGGYLAYLEALDRADEVISTRRLKEGILSDAEPQGPNPYSHEFQANAAIPFEIDFFPKSVRWAYSICETALSRLDASGSAREAIARTAHVNRISVDMFLDPRKTPRSRGRVTTRLYLDMACIDITVYAERFLGASREDDLRAYLIEAYDAGIAKFSAFSLPTYAEL